MQTYQYPFLSSGVLGLLTQPHTSAFPQFVVPGRKPSFLVGSIPAIPANPPTPTHDPTHAGILPSFLCVHAQSCPTLCDPMDSSLPGSSVHGILQAKNTGVSSHFLLRGIFPTQGSNPHLLCLLRWQADVFTNCATWEALCFLRAH